MKRFRFAALFACALAVGCSGLMYEGELGKISYMRVLQKLDLEIEKTESGLRVKAKADPAAAVDLLNKALDKIPTP